MKGGDLDRIVLVQRAVIDNSPSGEQTEAWLNIGFPRFASMASVSGIERFGSQQLEAKEQVEFRLRWAEDLADLAPNDRIIEPASVGSTNPPARSTYDIFAVLEIGRHEGLRVLATRRP